LALENESPSIGTREPWRLRSARETLALLRPHWRTFGITRVANVTGLDVVGIPTAVAVRPNARSLSVSQGKGLTLEQAKVSALMEAVELFHAEQADLHIVWQSIGRVRERSPLAVDQLPRMVTDLEDGRECGWVSGRDLFTDIGLPVPFELVHMDLTLPPPPGSGVFLFGSNGLGSGNDLPEAVVQALYEVIERDARTLFFLRSNKQRQKARVRLDSVSNADCQSLIEQFLAAGLLVAVWDVTSDVRVPAFLVAVLEGSEDCFYSVGLAYGSGCHFDPGVALMRALTEAAQTRLTRISGVRDDMLPEQFDALRVPSTVARDRLRIVNERSSLNMSAGNPAPLDKGGELSFLLEALRERGLDQAIVVDLSRPDLPVSVARCIVPGLEGIIESPGYVPGGRALEVINALERANEG
jgi:YcaO-like protein with predicted kinase domain